VASEHSGGRAGKREDLLLDKIWELIIERDALRLEVASLEDGQA
jgi:hypothetical protein